jgi:hypothetical protein
LILFVMLIEFHILLIDLPLHTLDSIFI